MRIIKILILIIMFLSFLPLHTMAKDDCCDHQATTHECALLVCQACSHSIALPETNTSFVSTAVVSAFVNLYNFSYENPTRLGFKKPPIFSA